jgi:hypothetical protein
MWNLFMQWLCGHKCPWCHKRIKEHQEWTAETDEFGQKYHEDCFKEEQQADRLIADLPEPAKLILLPHPNRPKPPEPTTVPSAGRVVFE